MQAACIRHSDIPHTSRIFRDLIYHFPEVASFYSHAPGELESYRAAAAEIKYSPEQRAGLVAALRVQNPGSPLLDELAKPGVAAVVTGQQVGLFGGPAYTIYKALTAVKLARELTAQGIPSVPLFWLATEDHDLLEVDHCWVFGPDHRPVQLRVAVDAESQTPVGEIAAPSYPIEELRQALGDLPFAAEAVEMTAKAYQGGRTLGESFKELLKQLLGCCEMLFIDPLRPEIRALAAPLLRQAVERSPELTEGLLQRNKELEERGYHAQVHVEKQTALFFLLENGKRINLKRQNGDFAVRDRKLSTAELAAQAEHLSPNALLRPVVQDSMIPTVAYIGGPAELAYFAQSQVLYEKLLGRMPVASSRSGFTLVDAPAQKRLERYHLTIPNILQGDEHLHEVMARQLVPEGLLARFAEARNATAKELERLRHELVAFDPTLAEAVKKSQAKVIYQFEKNERKVAREQMRRDERARADATALSNLIFPNKHLQERLYGILPFVAQHGPDIAARVYEYVRLDCPDHILLSV